MPSLSVDVETNMTPDLFSQMRAVFTLQRALAHERSLDGDKNAPQPLTCRQVLEMATMAGALAGDAWVANAAPMFGGIVALMPSAPISIAGAIAGFFVSIVLASLFFLLIEIANNTRNPFSP